MRDQTPAVAGHGAPVFPLDDHRCFIRGRDVEALTEVVGERLGSEDLGELGGRPFLGEASTHRRRSLWDPTREPPTASSRSLLYSRRRERLRPAATAARPATRRSADPG